MGTKKNRLESLLAQEIPLIVQQLNDPRLGFITITSVDVSKDFRSAKIHFSALGIEGNEESDNRIQLFEKVLNHSAPAVQREVAGKLNLRFTPKLIFVFSEGLRKSMEMSELIKKARETDITHEEEEDQGEDS